MTTAEIAALAAGVAMIIIFEMQLIGIKKDLKREIIMRRSNTRVIAKHIRELWQDLRAAGIQRFQETEECENDRSDGI